MAVVNSTRTGKIDDRLLEVRNATGASEAVPSEGGFLGGKGHEMGLKHDIAKLERTPGLLGTVGDLARLMNLTPRRIQMLTKEGTIAKAQRGGYDIIRCLAMYVAHLSQWRSAAEIPCSAADLARFLGLTKKQILYLSKIGAVPAIAPGRYDLASGIQAYLAYIRKVFAEGGVEKSGRKAPWRCPEVKSLKLF